MFGASVVGRRFVATYQLVTTISLDWKNLVPLLPPKRDCGDLRSREELPVAWSGYVVGLDALFGEGQA